MTVQVTSQVTNTRRKASAGSQKRVGITSSIKPRQRTDGSWVYRVNYRDATQKVRVVSFDTMKEATRMKVDFAAYGEQTALALLAARDAGPTTIPLLADFMRTHVAYIAGDIDDGTRRRYLSLIDRDIASQPIGQFPVPSVTKQMVKEWVLHLRDVRHLAPKTIRNLTGPMFAAFDYAIDEVGLCEVNPVRGVKVSKAQTVDDDAADMTFIEPDQFPTLLRHLDRHYWPLVTLMFGTGLRWGEATALRRKDLDLDASQPMLSVRVAWKHTQGQGSRLGPPKSKKSRRDIGLPAELVAILRPLCDGIGRDDQVLTNRQGRRIQQGTFYEGAWQPAQAAFEAATGKHMRVHDLRHSHASNFLKFGGNLVELQQRLGHESLLTTMVYTHLEAGVQTRAANIASLALSGAFPLEIGA